MDEYSVPNPQYTCFLLRSIRRCVLSQIGIAPGFTRGRFHHLGVCAAENLPYYIWLKIYLRTHSSVLTVLDQAPRHIRAFSGSIKFSVNRRSCQAKRVAIVAIDAIFERHAMGCIKLLIDCTIVAAGIKIPHRISRRRSARLLRPTLKESDWTVKRATAFTSTEFVSAEHSEVAFGQNMVRLIVKKVYANLP